MAATHSIPAEFVRPTVANKIKFKPRKKLPAHRLPFVGPEPGRSQLSFWAVPKSGGYGGGCDTGAALAKIYLKHLREHGRAASAGGFLQNIVLDMVDSEHGESPEQDALRGQVVGFFSVLEAWIEGAAHYLGGSLDQVDGKALLDMANRGLSTDYEAYLASLHDDE